MKDKDKYGSYNRGGDNPNFNRIINYEKFELPNFFEMKEFKIFNPYSLEKSLERLEKLSDEYLLDDYAGFAKKEFDFDLLQEETKKVELENVVILTRKKDDEMSNHFKFINLVDFSQYLDQDNRIDLQWNKEKKEFYIKIHVDLEPIFAKLTSIFNNDAAFEKSKNITTISKMNFLQGNSKKGPELDLVFKLNMVKRIYETVNKSEYILELSNPPLYKTNFLKIEEQNRNNEYEHCLFPFKNFLNEIANLKFRNFYLLLREKQEKTPENPDKDNDFSIFESEKSLRGYCKLMTTNQFKNITFIIKSEKQLREEYKLSDLELNEYFLKYSQKFIKEYEFDEANLISFNYQVLAIVSENILSYFNIIQFLEKIISRDDYFRAVFDNENFLPVLFTEAIVKLIELYKSADIELTVEEFENKLVSLYNTCQLDYHIHREKAFKKENKRLMRNMRVIVTPTYTLFMPYIEDQGNRILREHRKPWEGMRLVFKMDDFQDARWNNRFLMEYIKIYLSRGVSLFNYQYKFFCYSQSQFRSMGCWLVTNPEEILHKTGDYSNIKIIAKFGARVGQTLTTTIKTIRIAEESIKYHSEDVKSNDEQRKYTLSDGVGTITYDLAEKITRKLGLEEVPAAFQGRFLGCKGVWTVLFEDNSSEIWIRPSQKKFDKKAEGMNQHFEVCGYSKFIKCYLNRQIILLLSALGIKDEVFLKKLSKYRNKLEDEKFILSLIHYDEWNSTFMRMYLSGINRTNDRLVRSIVSANKEILYRDLKKKARIHIEEGAYVMGIMDEFGILEYGEAFLQISTDETNIILDKPCTVAKCPCLHPGDIRLLNFKKYNPNDPSTEKYRRLEPYKNVIIFPGKGPRSHPNELSGSDLDGDQYFIFYDPDLCNIKPVPPMDYSDDTKSQEKSNISFNDIIEFFAEYINNNNLGLIADAHLAHSDKDPEGANGYIPRTLAKKFSQAVDAPKTGAVVTLDQEEEKTSFPHYMGKNRNTHRSNHVLGQLFDKTVKYMEEIDKYKLSNKFYDEELLLKNYQTFNFEALIYYIKYYEELLALLRKNDILSESELLTGNNVDNELSGFGKKKHNYDIIERLALQMKELFTQYSNYFNESLDHILSNKKIYNSDRLKNVKSLRASAFYYIAYDFINVIENLQKNLDDLDRLKWDLENEISEGETIGQEMEDNYIQYQSQSLGAEFGDEVYIENAYINEMEQRKLDISNDLEKWKKIIISFISEKFKLFKIPKAPNEENQYRILSFPWCTAGNILIRIKSN